MESIIEFFLMEVPNTDNDDDVEIQGNSVDEVSDYLSLN